MPEIVILDLGYSSYDFEQKLFASRGYQLKLYKGPSDLNQKIEFCKNASGVLVRSTVVDERLFRQAAQLKAVVRYGVGYDNVNLEDATRQGVKVANVQGYATHSVSDHALALMFSCIRSLPLSGEHLQKGFGTPPVPEIFELHDKSLGIIGLGRIGSALASKARSLFKDIRACDPYVSDDVFKALGVRQSTIEDVLTLSHVISLHCNLTEETRFMIDQTAFEKMAQNPVLINTARGPVVNTKDLLDALNAGQLHSAGLDVFEDEPKMKYRVELLEHPRIQCTGHYAWYSDAASKALQQRAARNMVALLSDEFIEDWLNP